MGVSKIKAHSIGCGAVGCCRRPGREHVGQEVVRALRNERNGTDSFEPEQPMDVTGANCSGHAGKAWAPAVSDAASINTAKDGSNPG